jgi:serine/threonine-protein kinase
MGEVFLAEHPLIGKTVALKVIHQDLAVNKEVVARFINEAKAVSTIGNDHIVDVHDFGVSPEGAHFFIMEYLQGQTLANLVKTCRLTIEDSLHIAAQITAGLAAAHSQGIVHRDLKPDNIMLVEKLDDPLFVKILDFGLAKMLEGDQKLTAMGVVLGTPEFMSPEAAESKTIDGRSDIYSLGVLLFQMLTGRLPFVANSMGEMMVQQVCRPPPVPRGINPQIPPSVDQIVLRCLAKDPADRFQTMVELRQALLNPEQYLSGSPPMVPSEGSISSVSAQHPAMARPAAVDHNTMSIGTPYGYQSSGRGRGLVLFAIAVLSGGAGAGVALMEKAEAAEETVSVAPAEAVKPSDAMPDAVKAGSPASALADAVAGDDDDDDDDDDEITLRVTSVPSGATVVDEAGIPVGITPFKWNALADDEEIAWKFAHEGYQPKTHSFVPDSAQTIEVALLAEENPKSARNKRNSKKNSKKNPKDSKKNPKDSNHGENTMEPDF